MRQSDEYQLSLGRYGSEAEDMADGLAAALCSAEVSGVVLQDVALIEISEHSVSNTLPNFFEMRSKLCHLILCKFHLTVKEFCLSH